MIPPNVCGGRRPNSRFPISAENGFWKKLTSLHSIYASDPIQYWSDRLIPMHNVRRDCVSVIPTYSIISPILVRLAGMERPDPRI